MDGSPLLVVDWSVRRDRFRYGTYPLIGVSEHPHARAFEASQPRLDPRGPARLGTCLVLRHQSTGRAPATPQYAGELPRAASSRSCKRISASSAGPTLSSSLRSLRLIPFIGVAQLPAPSESTAPVPRRLAPPDRCDLDRAGSLPSAYRPAVNVTCTWRSLSYACNPSERPLSENNPWAPALLGQYVTTARLYGCSDG